MKERLGWVSNSSSSSFILAYKRDSFKNDESNDDLIEYIYNLPLFKTPNGHVLEYEMHNIVEKIVNGADRQIVFNTKEDILEEYGSEDWCEEELKFIEDGFVVISGSVSDDYDGNISDNLLYQMSFHYEDDKIYLSKES